MLTLLRYCCLLLCLVMLFATLLLLATLLLCFATSTVELQGYLQEGRGNRLKANKLNLKETLNNNRWVTSFSSFALHLIAMLLSTRSKQSHLVCFPAIYSHNYIKQQRPPTMIQRKSSKQPPTELQILLAPSACRLNSLDLDRQPPPPRGHTEASHSQSRSRSDSKQSRSSSLSYCFKPVSIFQIKKKVQWMNLNPNNPYASTREYQKFARGVLIGTNNLEIVLEGELDFIGNFQGVFEGGQPSGDEPYHFYFEGFISEIKILRTGGFQLTVEEENEYRGLSDFEGYFKGVVLAPFETAAQLQQNLARLTDLTTNEVKIYEQSHIRTKVSPVTEYFVPTLARFVVGRIESISIEKCSAVVWGSLSLTIQLNEDIGRLLKQEWEEQRKTKLNIEFNRQPPMALPFYDPAEFQATEEETEYEWDDVWEGIHWSVEWHPTTCSMEYSIQCKFNAEIDNTHSMFYAPFNLTFLKIIFCLHSIRASQNTLLHLSVADLQDFNPTANGLPKPYTPHTLFSELHEDRTKPDFQSIFQKHIDRETKISAPTAIGEYKVANNRLFLFPYHKRVFINKNTLNGSLAWMLGLHTRTTYFSKPEVYGVRESFQKALHAREQAQQRIQVYKMQRWNYVHIEIPIYKYPVIDLIRIFVPIMILATISLLIFGQENGVSNGFSLFARRISSGCSLLIAYVTLIPMIRSTLPPTPSITLIEIVIYLSTIPNFLAIISVYVTGAIEYQEFFNSYKPFADGLFLTSFLVCLISFISLILTSVLYVMKNYQKPFNLRKFRSSGMERACSPFFMEYMDQVRHVRKEYMLQELPLYHPPHQP